MYCFSFRFYGGLSGRISAREPQMRVRTPHSTNLSVSYQIFHKPSMVAIHPIFRIFFACASFAPGIY